MYQCTIVLALLARYIPEHRQETCALLTRVGYIYAHPTAAAAAAIIIIIIIIIILIIIIITRSLKKNLEAVPGKQSIDSLQKTAILGTSHIIRKVLQCEA
jgi:ABC-type transport system involved in cytochrome bd biosynthesis fused ATPase/permease subunit